MKNLVFLFAVAFACLAVLPCKDGTILHGDCATEVDGHETGDQHHPDETASELCSPFCSCHCCQIHKVGIAASEDVLIPLKSENKDTFISARLSKEFYSIWHPPKV